VNNRQHVAQHIFWAAAVVGAAAAAAPLGVHGVSGGPLDSCPSSKLSTRSQRVLPSRFGVSSAIVGVLNIGWDLKL
jgi:hypothetical protein